jgi:hypothetical protein
MVLDHLDNIIIYCIQKILFTYIGIIRSIKGVIKKRICGPPKLRVCAHLLHKASIRSIHTCMVTMTSSCFSMPS